MAYLIGSLPAAYAIGRRLKGVDLRLVGSGNLGAANTFREVGPWPGLLVLTLDGLKGVLAILIPGWVGAPEWAGYGAAVAVVAGHNWPVFLGFRGGKGAATVVGISLAVLPLLTLVTLAPTVLLFWLTRNIVLSTGFGFVLLNALTVASGQSAEQVALCLLLTFVVTATHYTGSRRAIADALKRGNWKALLSIE